MKSRRDSYHLFSDPLVFVLSIIALVALVLDYGYRLNYWMHLITDIFYILFAFFFTAHHVNQFPGFKKFKSRPLGYYFVMFLSAVLLLIAISNTIIFVFNNSSHLNFYTAVIVFVITLFELSGRLYNLNSQTLHPALVFVLSFAILICIGTLLLMAPKATVNGIHFIDALFTSTSAVCVTGLAVLNTGKDFTLLGQLAILFLIQFGALGILSFTYLFALFFKGFGSFESRLNLKDMINADTLDATFKRLIQIIIFVFVLEAIGSFLIFLNMPNDFGPFKDRLFFSVFHSISAFCNAGFSLLSNSLYEENVRFNYNVHIIIAALIIFGGIGYGVIINIFQYFKGWLYYFNYRYLKLSWTTNTQKLKPNITLNSKIVLYTTLILIVAGMALFYVLEINNTLQEHSTYGKIITSFFGSVTTRTAGFNTVDTGALNFSTIMIVLFFMWIGASPGSTGGGIKTTTFAVVTLNIIKEIFGFKNISVGYRKIASSALQRATAIMSLSLIMIGISAFLLIYFDEELGVMPLVFECFSAYSTVGLSMGITDQLSPGSKIVIIATMFIGRVGFLTLLTGLVQQIYTYQYSPIEYPEEEIFIN